LPRWHSVQFCRPLKDWNVPGAQSKHPEDASWFENLPGGHSEHVAAPANDANWPLAQSLHRDLPPASWKRPRGHEVQFGEPRFSAKEPARQGTQRSAEKIDVNLPVGQSWQTTSSPTEKVPGVHCAYDSCKQQNNTETEFRPENRFSTWRRIN
jgi:hypothetical protein